jgi:hypothetical protein
VGTSKTENELMASMRKALLLDVGFEKKQTEGMSHEGLQRAIREKVQGVLAENGVRQKVSSRIIVGKRVRKILKRLRGPLAKIRTLKFPFFYFSCLFVFQLSR